MRCKKYCQAEHLEHIWKWLAARKCYLPPASEMPAVGLVAHVGDSPVAAGFLRMVEGNYAILDGLVSNPEIPGPIRNDAIDFLVKQLLFKGKEMGLRHLLASSVDERTLVRSKRHGFVHLPHTLIIADLTSGQEVE